METGISNDPVSIRKPGLTSSEHFSVVGEEDGDGYGNTPDGLTLFIPPEELSRYDIAKTVKDNYNYVLIRDMIVNDYEWMRREMIDLGLELDDPDEGTRQLFEKYNIPLILLTLGPDGAYYRRGEETGRADGFAVKVADTNGAGDTFFGAFLSRMAVLGVYRPENLSAEQLYESVRTANLAASLTTSRHGAIPAMPNLDELEKKLAEVK